MWPLKVLFVNLPLGVIKFFIGRYIFIHNISKIYVNKNTGEVYVKANDDFKLILKIGKYRKDKFKIEKETLSEIQEILNKKNQSV